MRRDLFQFERPDEENLGDDLVRPLNVPSM